MDELVRSLLCLENPHGDCGVRLCVSAVQASVGEHELQPTGWIGLHNTHACYNFGSGGAVRCVMYHRSNCKRKKAFPYLSFPRLNALTYLQVTPRSEVASCCPPLYVMLHRKCLLLSSLEGKNLRVDVAAHWASLN